MINRGFELMLPKRQVQSKDRTVLKNNISFTIFKRKYTIVFDITSEEVC